MYSTIRITLDIRTDASPGKLYERVTKALRQDWNTQALDIVNGSATFEGDAVKQLHTPEAQASATDAVHETYDAARKSANKEIL